jgi:hypothetical protein
MISKEFLIPHKPGISVSLESSGLRWIHRKMYSIWFVEIEVTKSKLISYEFLEALLSAELDNRQKIKLPENARKLPIDALDNFSRVAMLYQFVSFTLEKIVSFISKS